MEPTGPTSESLDNLARHGDPQAREQLLHCARRVREMVPSATGLSIAKRDGDVIITLVASSDEVLPLEAIQHLDGGPSVDAVVREVPILADEPDPLSETRWSMFARASAAQGVRSTLSLPLIDDGEVVGGVNVYASEEAAFEGHVVEIAGLFDAWAPGAIRDSDMSFSTRRAALDSADELARRERLVQRAVEIIARVEQVDADSARELLAQSAIQAGVSERDVARTIVVLHD